MKYGICKLAIVPLRLEQADASEQVSQLLFGETYTVLEARKKWLRIRCGYDAYEGWIDRKQHAEISKETFLSYKKHPPALAYDVAQMIDLGDIAKHQIIVQGSSLHGFSENYFMLNEQKIAYNGEVAQTKFSKANLIDVSFSYLNTPYLWGGRSPFGIDCSGLSQMVYKFAQIALPRDASEQAKLGEPLSFIEEAEPGDLAFFDNNEGHIVHVGILLANNYIIHASGQVRIDRLDQYGIYNAHTRTHTHRLRVIKKIM